MFRVWLAIIVFSWTAFYCSSNTRSVLAKIEKQCALSGFANTELSQPIDSLLSLSSEINYIDLLKSTYMVEANLNHAQRFRDAVNWGGEVIPLLSENMGNKSKDELQFYIYLLDEFGSACNAMGQQSKLCDTYLKALNIAKLHDMTDEEAILLNNVASVYYSLGDNDSAMKYLHEAIRINETAKNSERLFVNYNNLSGIYVSQGNFDKALEYAFLALHQLDGKNHEEMEMLMQRNICSIYRKQGHTKMALDMMQKISDYQIENKQVQYLTDTYRLMGSLYSDIGDYDSARSYFEKALAVNINTPVTIKTIILKELARIQSLQGNYKEAYETMLQFQRLRDSVNIAENKSRMEIVTNLYNSEQDQTNRINSLETWNTNLTWLIVILFTIVILIAIFWWRNHSKNHSNLHENAPDNDLENDTRLLTERIEELENKIAQKDSQMMHLSVLATRDTEFIESLNKSLKETLLTLSPKNADARKDIRNVLSLISNYETNGNIDELNEVFNNVYPSFYDNLFKEFGELTPKEMRLCALIRLGLSTKSIAAITYREVRSVESARNRLRKKFGLQHDDSLSQFLRRF